MFKRLVFVAGIALLAFPLFSSAQSSTSPDAACGTNPTVACLQSEIAQLTQVLTQLLSSQTSTTGSGNVGTAQAAPFTEGQQVQTSASVNVRQSAGGAILTQEQSGTDGTIESCSSSLVGGYTWCEVNFEGTSGWVASDFLQGASSTSSGTTDASAPSANLTLNGQTNLTVGPSTPVTAVWSSQNAASWHSAYSASGCTNDALDATNANWNVADNAGGTGGGNISGWAGCTITYTYTATNSAGQSAQATATLVVNATANLSANLTYGVAPMAVTFTYTDQAPGRGYSIDFGDGNSGTLTYNYQNPSGAVYEATHTYNDPGTFTATVTSTNGGNAGSTVGSVSIQTTSAVTYGANLPQVTLTVSPQSITLGQSATATWSSKNATSCTSSQFSTGGQTSGSASLPFQPLANPDANGIVQLTISCTGSGGTSSAVANLSEPGSLGVVNPPIASGTTGILNFTIGLEPGGTWPIVSGQEFMSQLVAVGISSCSISVPSGVTIVSQNGGPAFEEQSLGSATPTGYDGVQVYEASAPGTYTFTATCGSHTATASAVVESPVPSSSATPSASLSYSNFVATPNSGPGPYTVTLVQSPGLPSVSATQTYVIDYGDGTFGTLFDHIYQAAASASLTSSLITSATYTAKLYLVTPPASCPTWSTTGACSMQSLTQALQPVASAAVTVTGGPVNLLATNPNTTAIGLTSGLSPYTVTFNIWAPTNGPFSPYTLQFGDGSSSVTAPTCTPTNGVCTTPATISHTYHWTNPDPTDPTAGSTTPITYEAELSGTNNPYGTLGAMRVTVTPGTAQSMPPAPTATVTLNGLTNLTVDPSTPVTAVWSSTNATSWNATYTASGCSNSTLDATNANWTVADNAAGTGGGDISGWAGCTINYTYTATNSAGQSAQATATLVVNATASLSAGSDGMSQIAAAGVTSSNGLMLDEIANLLTALDSTLNSLASH